jgi:hypothetical protein
MDVSQTLKTAWEAVESAELPKEIQEAAFREAVRLLAPDQSVAPVTSRLRSQTNAASSARTTTGGTADDDGVAPAASEEEIYTRVATQTGVDRDLLEQLVHLDGTAIKISVPGLRLGRNNAERARAVAQILTVTRGFGFEEPGTPLEVIRTECERLKVYDQANFSSQIKALGGYVITGSGPNRRLRARGAGIQAFGGLVANLIGGE